MRLLNNRIDMANGNGYLVDENGNKFYPIACKLYMKEDGFGDKFAVVPEFNGEDDRNKLRIQGAVGGAGTDPALYDLMTISGKSGTVWTKGHIVNSFCRVNTVVGSWVRLFTMSMSAAWKSYGVWFSLCDCQYTNENTLVNIYIHRSNQESYVQNFQCLDLNGGNIQNRLKVVQIDIDTFDVYFKMVGSDSPSISILGTNSLISNNKTFGDIVVDCNTVVETLPNGTQWSVFNRLQRCDVLYDNSSGSNGTIGMNANVSAYNRIFIAYKNNDNQSYGVTIENPLGRDVSLISAYVMTGNYFMLKGRRIRINDTQITTLGYGEGNYRSGFATEDVNNTYIYKVLGYKFG